MCCKSSLPMPLLATKHRADNGQMFFSTSVTSPRRCWAKISTVGSTRLLRGLPGNSIWSISRRHLKQTDSKQNQERRTCHKRIHPFGMSPAVRRHQVVIQKQFHSVMFRSPKGQGQTTAEAETVALRDGDVMKL